MAAKQKSYVSNPVGRKRPFSKESGRARPAPRLPLDAIMRETKAAIQAESALQRTRELAAEAAIKRHDPAFDAHAEEILHKLSHIIAERERKQVGLELIRALRWTWCNGYATARKDVAEREG